MFLLFQYDNRDHDRYSGCCEPDEEVDYPWWNREDRWRTIEGITASCGRGDVAPIMMIEVVSAFSRVPVYVPC